MASCSRFLGRGGTALVLFLVGCSAGLGQSPEDPFGVQAMRQSRMSTAMADGSSAFVANKGQWDSEALFLSRTSGVDSWITPTGVVYDFHRYVEVPELPRMPDLRELAGRGPRPFGVSEEQWNRQRMNPREERRERRERARRVGHIVRMAFLDTAPIQEPEGEGLQQGHFNYYIGSDESKWATDVPRYASAVVRNLYPGIDAVYYVDSGSPRYDLVVRPGADPSRIRFELSGAESLRVTPEGRLTFGTQFGEFEMKDLRAFQGSRSVRCTLSVSSDGVVRFLVGAYDRSKPLTIDPLVSSTFLGGDNWSWSHGIAVDGSDNSVVCGYTTSPDFPASEGPYIDRTLGGNSDGFVARLDPSGWLLSSTYLGGSSWDEVYGVAVDESGNAAVCGYTASPDFPASSGPYIDRTLDGSEDAFVARLDPSGALLASTYLGGNADDWANCITVNGSGNAIVCGSTRSSDFPTTAGAYGRTIDGFQDGFVTLLNPSGWLLSSTYLGGSSWDEVYGVAVDGAGNAIVCGRTNSADFPTTAGAYDRTLDGSEDAFVARLDSSGTLLASTYLGGNNWDAAYGIAVDGSGNSVVCGATTSSDFPTTAGAHDRTINGSYDAFVTRLDSSGTLLASTYLGGNGTEYAWGVAVDGSGNAIVGGMTSSVDFPTHAGAYDRTHNGLYDAYVAVLAPSGGLLSSTFLGGSFEDYAEAVAWDGSGNAAVSGGTGSVDFPTTEGAHDRLFVGSDDAFVARFNHQPTAPISGRLVLGDFSGDASTQTASIQIRVGGMTAETIEGVVLTSDGSFAVSTKIRGTADIIAKSSHWLSKRTTQTWGDAGLTGLVFELINGDVDGDNAVTVFDYSMLSDAFDSMAGDPNWLAAADLDGDGAVTVFDYMILSNNFDRVGDD